MPILLMVALSIPAMFQSDRPCTDLPEYLNQAQERAFSETQDLLSDEQSQEIIEAYEFDNQCEAV